MTTKQQISNDRIYPGLICGGIEFFNIGGTLKVISRGSVKDFKDAPYSYHLILKEQIEKEPEVENILREWFPDSEIKRLVQFGSCRFGNLDFKSDVVDYELQDPEYFDCPNRGQCPAEGIICKPPKYKGAEISFFEIKILKALVTTDTNENIAFKLGLPQGSFNLAKTKLYQKLKIQTKQEAAMVAVELNLI